MMYIEAKNTRTLVMREIKSIWCQAIFISGTFVVIRSHMESMKEKKKHFRTELKNDCVCVTGDPVGEALAQKCRLEQHISNERPSSLLTLR